MRKCTGRVRLLEIPDAKKGTLKKAITLRVQPGNTTLKITRHEEIPLSQGTTVEMKCSVKTEALLEKGRLLFPDDCKDTSKGWKPLRRRQTDLQRSSGSLWAQNLYRHLPDDLKTVPNAETLRLHGCRVSSRTLINKKRTLTLTQVRCTGTEQ